MVVVTKEEQLSDQGIAQIFFIKTLGSIHPENQTGYRIFNAFLAISSLGNIIVMTYTAARVKQEIAKEGILPWPKFFAQNRDMSLGRLLRVFERKGWFTSLLRIKWFSPEEHREQTPVGAFVLHFGSCLILIFATWGMTPDDAYTLLTNLSAYAVNAFFAIFLGLGILILRFRGPPAEEEDQTTENKGSRRTWREMTGKHINPYLSVACASIYAFGGLWPVVTTWIKPSRSITIQKNSWYLAPAISWAVIAIGVGWFLGFILVAWHRSRKYHKVFVVEKQPEFEYADNGVPESEQGGRGSGGLVLVHETVYLSWVGSETLRARRAGEVEFDDGLGGEQMVERPGQARPPVSGTDFDAYFMEQQRDGGYGAGYGTGYRP